MLQKRILLLVIVGLMSCSKDEQEATPLFTPVDLAQPWQTSNAAEERIGDLSSLAANAAKADSCSPPKNSLLINPTTELKTVANMSTAPNANLPSVPI